MDRHEYMTTGGFASAMGVSKDTLFHYDDIGLFCPEKVSENGYRYYSIYQMETCMFLQRESSRLTGR